MIKADNLKKILGKKIIAYIKLMIAYPQYNKNIRWLSRKNRGVAMLLLGTPIHDNLGDHLIAEAEKEILEELFPEYKLFEVPMEMFFLYKEELKKNICRKDIIFISGGGWMGNLWEHDEKMMQNIIYSFQFNRVFIFPQTIYYDKKKDNYLSILKSAQECYRENNNLIIALRDRKSYEIACSNLMIPPERVYLLPDVGLVYQDIHIEFWNRKKAALCMREDCEKEISNISIENVKKILVNKNIEYVFTNTITKGFLPICFRKNKLKKKLQEFMDYSVVITDRLHAMILAALVNTPCIAFNNRTGKVFGVYSLWLQNKSKVIFVNSQEELEETMSDLEYYFSKLPNFHNEEYFSMFQVIKEIMKFETKR